MIADVLHTHAAFAAFNALLQWVGFMPLLWPWLATTALGRQLGFLPTLGFGIALGLVANFQAFFFVVMVGQSTWPVWSPPVIAFVFTVVAWACLVRCSRHVQPVILPHIPGKHSLVRHGLGMVAMAAALGIFMHDVARDLPGVFVAWDTVVSWNRWATEWHRQILPIYTVGYPQLLPTALADLYAWIAPEAAQPIARVFLLLFPILPCLLFVDGYRRWRDDAFLWGGAAWLVMLRFAFRGMADSGYADVPVASFVALTVYLLLLGWSGRVDRAMGLTLAAIAAAAALLIKQPGGIAWLLWLGVATALALQRRVSWASVIAGVSLFLALAAPWYLFTAWRIRTGADITNIGYLVGSIHADRNWMERVSLALQGPLMEALAGFGSATVAASTMVVLLVMACWRMKGRLLVFGLCLPYVLLWASLFSYDIRNIMPAMVPVALALGLGVRQLLDLAGKALPVAAVFADSRFLARLTLFKVSRWASAGAVAVAGLLAWVAPWSVEDLRLRQAAWQREADDPALNRYLLDYARNPGFSGLVLTTYAPMLIIEELRRHTLSLAGKPELDPAVHRALMQGQPWCELVAMEPRVAQVRYLLLHSTLSLPTISSSLAEGSLRLVHEQGGLQLMQVGCPHP